MNKKIFQIDSSINNTISNEFIHAVLILLEYYICVFPFTNSSVRKITNFNSKFHYTNIEKSLLLLSRIKFLFIKEQVTPDYNYLLEPYFVSIIVITIILTVNYIFSFFIYKRKRHLIIEAIFANFYGIFFFRYFSYIFIDTFTFLVANEIIYNHNVTSMIILYLIIIIQVGYYITIWKNFELLSLFFTISNKLIIHGNFSYPFDDFSQSYDTQMLFMKIAVSFESNILFLYHNKVTYFSLFLNLVIVIYSFLMMISQCFLTKFQKNKQISSLTNFRLNLIRKILLCFNCLCLAKAIVHGAAKNKNDELISIIVFILVSFGFNLLKWSIFDVKELLSVNDVNITDIYSFLLSKEQDEMDIQSLHHSNKVDCFFKNNLSALAFSELKLDFLQKKKKNCKCGICQKLLNKNVGYYQKVYNLYKYKRRKHLQMSSYTDILIRILYSKIKSKLYQYYKYLYFILSKQHLNVPQSVKNLLYLLYYTDKNIKTHYSNDFFLKLENLKNYNDELESTLKKFKILIEEDNSLKTAGDILFLSNKIQKLKHILKKFLDEDKERNFNKNENKEKFQTKEFEKESYKKNIQSIIKYNILINRYIIETLINGSYIDMTPLNIDFFDEFFTGHFNHDSFFVITSSVNPKETNNLFSIIKMTGSLKADNSNLTDYFPQKFQKEGKEKLIEIVNAYKSFSTGTFEYIISNNNYIEHFKMKFESSKSLLDERLVLFGYYYTEHGMIIILNANDDDSLNIEGYSKKLAKHLLLKPKDLEILNKGNKSTTSIKFFFKKISFITHNETPNQNMIDKINSSIIECELDYNYLISNCVKLFENMISNSKSKKEQELYEKLSKVKPLIGKYKKKKSILLLEKIFRINKNNFLFKVTIETIENKMQYLNSCSFNIDVPLSRILVNKEEGDQLQKSIGESNSKELFINQLKGFASSISLADNASISDEQYQMTSSTIKDNDYLTNDLLIKKESHLLELGSFIIIILNFVLIILCFIFLIIQISQTNELDKVDTLYFTFKTIRHQYNNAFLSCISLTCLCEKEDCDLNGECENKFITYLNNMQKSLNFSDYSLGEYMFYEAVRKTDTLKRMVKEFKMTLSKKKYNRFLELLDTEVTFVQLEKHYDGVKQQNETLRFEDGLDIFINAQFLILQKEGKWNITIIPMRIINVTKGELDYSKINPSDLNHYHIDAFMTFWNFPNFAASFNKGEKMLDDYFNKIKGRNLALAITFMVIILFLNGVLLGINLQNLHLGNMLFKKIFMSSVFTIDDHIYKEYLNKKINNLILLSSLYKKNPNKIIQEISNQKTRFGKDLKKERNKHEHVKQKQKNQTEIDEEMKLQEEKKKYFDSLNNSSYQMKYFEYKIINPIFYQNIKLYCLYFITIGILDMVIVLMILAVYSFKNYVNINYSFQAYLYTPFSLIHLTKLFNMTESALAGSLQKSSMEDGIINVYIRDAFSYQNEYRTIQKKKNFLEQNYYFIHNCSTIYEEVDDYVFADFHKEKNLVDEEHYYKLQKIMCRRLEIERDGYYIYEHFLSLLQNAHNRHKIKTYDGIFSIYNDVEFFRAALYFIFYIRPVKRTFDLNVLKPKIQKKFKEYQKFVWIYLIVNILLSTTIFLISRLVISKRLNHIKENFFLFYRCIQS